MLTKKNIRLSGGAVAAAVLAALMFSTSADAAQYITRGAAILVWPDIAVIDGLIDTRIQLSNLSNEQRTAHCFYVNANSHCSNTGEVCSSFLTCQRDGFFGSCVPGWIEVNFDVVITGQQPVAWSASEGLSTDDLACRPRLFFPGCPKGSNAGTRVPPVAESPFVGELKCIEVDPLTRLPERCGEIEPLVPCRNDFTGRATIERIDENGDGQVNPANYNAIGLRTSEGNDGDNDLIIGGDPATEFVEYQSCPEVLVLDHLFDGAIDPISGTFEAFTDIALVPCTQDFRAQTISPVTAQFLVYNEFEQRFSTSRQVRCLLNTRISEIDTTQSERSIFWAGVAGTVAGQTRIRGVGGGLLGTAELSYATFGDSGYAGYGMNQAVDRSVSDVISLP